jgi:hypothetical protein
MSGLRWIWLDGPPLLTRSADDNVPDPFKAAPGRPLWSLLVGASYFDPKNAADYAQPVRTLMIDARTTTVSVEGNKPFFQTGKKQHEIRTPRLLDVHVIAGAGTKPYRPNTEGIETLEINFAAPLDSKRLARVVNSDADHPRFATVGATDDPNDAQKGFVHVVAEPLMVEDSTQKGDFIDQAGATGNAAATAIRIPRLRPLQGAIRLRIREPQRWLGNLDPRVALPPSDSFELVLTPSGIEIVTAVDFPGSADKLKGVFQIAPRDLRTMRRDLMAGVDTTSGFRISPHTLTLLPRETSLLPPAPDSTVTPVAAWMAAWREAASPALPRDDEKRCGIDIRALPADLPPRFSWPLYLRKEPTSPEVLVVATAAAADPPLAVDAPVNRLHIELRGSKGPDGTHEGAATVMATRLRIATRAAAQKLAQELLRQRLLDAAEVPKADSGTVIVAEAYPERASPKPFPPARYWTVSTITKTESVTMKLLLAQGGMGATIPLSHDEHRLAATLRTAVGWEEPQRKPPDEKNPDTHIHFTQEHRPVISGFVPLERGWVQLPLPNLPPLDLSKDTSLIGAIDPTPATVLDGFIRIAQRPAASFVSGYSPQPGAPVGATAPWSITVEGAGTAVVMAAIEANELKQTRAVLREPDLAARGLVWLSADRPDELEALPRLGAGPGSFFDLDLTTTPAPDPSIRVVTARLSALTLNFDLGGAVSRATLNLSLQFNTAAGDWQNGPAGTPNGRDALARAYDVLVGTNASSSAPAGLDTLREALADAKATLEAAESDFAEGEQRRVALAAAIAAASSEQASLRARAKALEAPRAQAKIDFDRARADSDPERDLATSANLDAITREIDELDRRVKDSASRLEAMRAEKATLDGSANVRGEQVRLARKQEENAGSALAAAEGGAAIPVLAARPWPAVAWLRHPDLPVAAGMPMTRAAASAVRPLESRELAPFVASTVASGGTITLASFTWEGDKAFPALAASPIFVSMAKGWPRPDAPGNTGDLYGPSEGVPFAAFGVPGVEIMPVAAKEWEVPDFAVRYDLPSLDEAFATAGLPPVAEPLPQQDEREQAADLPSATALDWPLMRQFWDDQERRRNLSLVVDSYLDNFHTSKTPHTLAVKTLVRGTTWTVNVEFKADFRLHDLTYGAIAMDAPAPSDFTANEALKGLSGTVKVKPDTGGTIDLDVLGWSPSSFDRDDLRFDNQGFGIGRPERHAGTVSLITRPYRKGLGSDARQFATAEQEIPIPGPVPLAFWFKDVPLSAAGGFSRGWPPADADAADTPVPDTAVDFKAWLSPEEGYEWRLHRSGANTFDTGRDRFAFFGVAIEPLRLLLLKLPVNQSGKVTSGVPTRLDILARVSLADNVEQPIAGGNLVVMTFTGDGSALQLNAIKAVGTPSRLTFAFEAEDRSRQNGSTATRRRVLLRANPAWDGGKLTLTGAALTLSLHGRSVTLDEPTITCEDQPAAGSVTITWPSGGAAAPQIEPGEARLRVTQLTIKSSLDTTVRFQRAAELRLDRILEICSAQARRGAPEFVAEFAAGAATPTLRLLNTHLNLAGTDLREDDHAIVLTWSSSTARRASGIVTALSPAGLLPGLTPGTIAENGIALMLAACIEAPSDSGILPFGCGRCEGEMHSSDHRAVQALHTRRVRWEFDGRRGTGAKSVWDGFIAISGVLSAMSAIKWPRLATSAGGSAGRRRVTRSAETLLLHRARYVFDDHRLPLDACRPDGGGSWTLVRPWTTFVAVHHKLVKDPDQDETAPAELQWTGMESIAIGQAADLIPPLPTGNTVEPVTFAARYRTAFHGAPSATATMIQPGLGAIQTVLQGVSGTAFRTGFANAPGNQGMAAVAGFIGLQGPDGSGRDVEEPLVRLPFIAGLNGDALAFEALSPGKFSQTEFPSDGIELAWADTAAARSLLVRDRHAVAPASVRQADLIAAVRAGALIGRKAGLPKGNIVAALAVEQTFGRNPPAEPAPADWTKVPYWIGSAVTVSRAVERYAGAPPRDFRPLSLLAGSILMEDNRTRGTAALLQGIAEKLLDHDAPPTPPALISGGIALALEDWAGGDAETAGDSGVNGYAAGLASARHARPLFAVVRSSGKEGFAHYTAVTLPRAVSADLPAPRQGSREQTRFAEGARGYSAEVGAKASRWLLPVLEGPIAAVRDEGPRASGLAGLGRSLAFPAQAGQEICNLAEPEHPEHREALARELIWFSEKRIPVYWPLDVTAMETPAIPWLQAAPPRVRLPDDSDVALVLTSSGLGDPDRSPKRTAAQSFLPPAADALTVSERAGIVTARRSFLMGALPNTTAFDPEQGRFGRAGQAGSSVRHWMRTPRPAQLPPNHGAPDRDRRPEASPLLPLAPLRFLVGPADTVRGVSKDSLLGAGVPWSATMVAAPLSDGVVSDRWDGTVRVAVELDVAAATEPGDPAVLLVQLLLPVDKTTGQAPARGSLKVGDTLVPLRWITVTARSGDWVQHHPDGTPVTSGQTVAAGEQSIWRKYLDLILDPREQQPAITAGAGTIHAGLAAALSAGSFTVELRLTLHPSAGASPTIAVGVPVALMVAADEALAHGSDRPPVTLRWNLPAVTAQRGGMPLLPTTLLFVDPAYEFGLTNPPHEKAVLLDTKDVSGLPANRGAVRAVFSADRGRVNRRASVAFMVDARFERAPAALAPIADGDLAASGPLVLLLKLIPKVRTEPIRFLTVAGKAEPEVKFAEVYELSLGALTELDGGPARMQAGDVLELTVTERQPEQVNVVLRNSETGVDSGAIRLSKKPDPNAPKPPADQASRGFGLSLPLTLTDEPVVEPPTALYAALTLNAPPSPAGPVLSLPLYAQSPLPWRVDFRNLKQDFRAGLVRRSATFVWGLTRPLVEIGTKATAATMGVHVVKMDKNGQTHLPEERKDFLPPERVGGA